MIVRDEAELLPRFLECAKGLWDELCVVDTGSRDATVSILEGAGAKVLRHAWNDDFAAARNVGLTAASGEWILFLDADEMVSPAFVGSARALLDRSDVGAATLEMVNPLPQGHRRVNRLLRMFRNDPAIRFRYPIHEEVHTAVSTYLAATGKKLFALNGAVEHLGYVRDRAAAKDKRTRDRRILRRCIEADPLDLYSHFKVLEQDRFWGDARAWGEDARAAAEALDRSSPELLREAPFGGELVALVVQGLFPRGGPEALALLDRSATTVMPSPAFFLRRAEVLEGLGDGPRAAEDFAQCLKLAHLPGDTSLATVRPWLGLARLHWAAGQLGEAEACVARARTHAPADLEGLLAAVALARQRGGASAVDAWRAEEVAARGESPELSMILAEEARLQARPGER